LRKDLVFGTNLIFDAKKVALQKYDFGLSWSPATGSYIGLKHESKKYEENPRSEDANRL